jgi:PAS domain S-box-containing protein
MSNEMFSVKLPAQYQGLEYIGMPVVLVDKQFNLLHFNSNFAELLRKSNAVFPARDLMEIFPDFYQQYVLSESVLLPGTPLIISGLRHFPTGLSFDLHLNQIEPHLDHLELISVTCVDVTSKHKQLQLIKESSEQHEQFLKYTNTCVIIHQNGKIVFANQRADKLAALPEGETLLGKSIIPFVTEAFKEKIAERIRLILDNKTVIDAIEDHFVQINGNRIDVEVFAFPVSFNGEFAIKTLFTDITDRKNAEQLLLESRQQYYTLVENLTDVVFQTDTNACFTYLNTSWDKLTGFSIFDTLGKPCFDYLHHPHNTEAFYLKVRKLLEYGAQDFQYELMLKSAAGEHRFVEVSLKPIYDAKKMITGINGIIRDIHNKKIADIEIKRIQKTIKRHQEILVSLTKEESIIKGDFNKAIAKIAEVTAQTLDISSVNVWAFNDDHTVLDCLVNYHSKTQRFVEGKPLSVEQFPTYFKTLLRDRIIVADDAINDPRTSEFNVLYNLPHEIYSMMDIAISKGETIWGVICVESRGKPYKWTLEDQSFARSIGDFIALAHKSSLLQHTQQELLKQENLYRILIEQARDAVIIIDANDRFVEVNNAMCQLSGYSREELLSMPVAAMVPKRFINKDGGTNIQAKYKNGYFGERIFLNKKGEERIAEISARIFPDGRIQGIGRDITERKLQEKALRDSEARLELALKGADLGIWDFYIPENKMVHNKRWGEMLGYHFENTVVNQQFRDKFIHPEDKDIAYAAFQAHLRGETPFYETTVRMLASNGEWRWIMDKGKVTEWDSAGNPIRATGIHQDITTIRNYEEQLINQRKFLQEIINATPNLIYVRNAHDEYVTVNNAFTDFLGCDINTLNASNSVRKSFNQTLLKFVERDTEVFYTRKPVLIDEHIIIEPQTAKPMWFKTIKVPLINDRGDFSEVLSVSMNITELKSKEQQLSQLNDQLETKVKERTSLLESANKELETFNYSVSHDMRTPLRSIDIFAYFLDKNYSQFLDKDGLENIRQIRRSIIKMTALIDNLLIFSKIGRSSLKYDKIDTADLIEEVLNIFRDRDDISGYKIVINDLPELNGDYPMLKQAFVNLIGNAIKYSRNRKEPTLEFFATTNKGYITIGIRDNGVGFSMDLKDKLFTAFKRLHSDEQFEGTGVGLAIVERIIKRHNGTVWAESKENEGSTFYFNLPIITTTE